ncbi:MAG: molybdopterin-dependent oxidoreductase [Ignavibacteriales bacterium]|nr:molybdopterin-dependent oxidoreductase [Ignavibacteriales bacterium]
MEMNITRREILRFVGGSALGFLLTPIPWKALDDSAIWTQNWPWIPEPSRGDVSYKLTTCSLCPAACGMRARCIGNQPVSLSGMKTHPLNQGALCPIGIVAHHLRYHPARVSRPLRIDGTNGSFQSTTMTFDESLNEISVAIKDASGSSQFIACVDGRPKRTASSLFQQFAANIPNGKYIPVGEASLDVLASLFEKPCGPFSYDLDNAQTILSFGVPLFDSWGTPARTARYIEKKSEAKQRVIQVETFQSRTAGMADQWIPIRPGTDAVFALGLVHVILIENLFRVKPIDIAALETMISAFSPSVVAEVCGVSQEIVKETARAISANGPSVAVIDGFASSREAQIAVMVLNLLTGTIGRKGGIAVRREIPSAVSMPKNSMSVHSSMNLIPDHSIRVMLIDESLSGCRLSDALLQKKLAENGIIVSLSPFVTERSFCTQFVIPTPVFLESYTELTSPYDSALSSLSISAPLVPVPAGVVDPIQFIQRLAAAAGIQNIEQGTTEELLKKRITALYNEKRGSAFNASNGQSTEVKNLVSTDELWNALLAGGCWMDSAWTAKSLSAFRIPASLSAIDINKMKMDKNQLMLVPFVERTIYGSTEISPLMSKTGQESRLRAFGSRVYLNTKTGFQFGIVHGCRVLLQTDHGSMHAEARFDDSIMPDIAAVSDTMNLQNLFSLFEMSNDSSIRPTPVKIQKV